MELDEASVPDREAAERLLDKLRAFVVNDLNEEEATLLAALLAPGMALATAEEQEVVAFGSEDDWRPGALPRALVEAVRGQLSSDDRDPD
ncbi:MAG TPA: hypothetical protein VK277_12085 [Acidimicrobiales bacterium]|nr:hypothetical protein [Acidimicrobiales bacterium]